MHVCVSAHMGPRRNFLPFCFIFPPYFCATELYFNPSWHTHTRSSFVKRENQSFLHHIFNEHHRRMHFNSNIKSTVLTLPPRNAQKKTRLHGKWSNRETRYQYWWSEAIVWLYWNLFAENTKVWTWSNHWTNKQRAHKYQPTRRRKRLIIEEKKEQNGIAICSNK